MCFRFTRSGVTAACVVVIVVLIFTVNHGAEFTTAWTVSFQNYDTRLIMPYGRYSYPLEIFLLICSDVRKSRLRVSSGMWRFEGNACRLFCTLEYFSSPVRFRVLISSWFLQAVWFSSWLAAPSFRAQSLSHQHARRRTNQVMLCVAIFLYGLFLSAAIWCCRHF